jgi:threonine synthase
MIAVQATGCAPIVKAFDEGVEDAPVWPNAHTIASGIRVPVAVGDFLVLRAVRQSGGYAMAVEDAAIDAARSEVARNEGLLLYITRRTGGALQLWRRTQISNAASRDAPRPA